MSLKEVRWLQTDVSVTLMEKLRLVGDCPCNIKEKGKTNVITQKGFGKRQFIFSRQMN